MMCLHLISNFWAVVKWFSVCGLVSPGFESNLLPINLVEATNEKSTLSMSKIVFIRMSNMMKFSNGCDVTNLQMWYRIPVVSGGTYSSRGFAWMAKSMHDFCGNDRQLLHWHSIRKHLQIHKLIRICI